MLLSHLLIRTYFILYDNFNLISGNSWWVLITHLHRLILLSSETRERLKYFIQCQLA